MAVISEMSISQLIGQTVECGCGRQHAIRTKALDLRAGAHSRLYETLGGPKNVFVLCDERTLNAAGRDVAEKLSAAGAKVTVKVLFGDDIHADEPVLGQALLALPSDADMIVGVGSGTINDSCRYLALQTRRPYAIVGTAPSMDGYASTVTPLLVGGFKRTFDGVHPEAICGEPDVLSAAPQNMVAAGVGDILGKYVALCDWRMARDLTDEHYCAELALVIQKAMAEVSAAVPGLLKRDPDAVAGLTGALALSGLAMQMAGSSRPASGCEHHLSHFWEMRLMSQGKPALLHGDKVGVGTLVAMDAYRRFFAVKREPKVGVAMNREEGIRKSFGAMADEVLVEATRVAHEAPANQREERVERLMSRWGEYRDMADELFGKQAEVKQMLESLGGPTHPRQVGIDRAGLEESLLWAKEVRPRYTLLRAMDDMGCLTDIAAEVANAWYE